MAVEALCTVFTVPGIGQHRIDVMYLYGDPGRPSLGRYSVSYDGERVYDDVWHDQDADHWTSLMAKAADAVARHLRSQRAASPSETDHREGSDDG